MVAFLCVSVRHPYLPHTLHLTQMEMLPYTVTQNMVPTVHITIDGDDTIYVW